MKKLLLVSVTLVLATGTAFAGFLAKDTRSVRLDYVYDDEAGAEEAHGVEAGFGSALYALDDVSVNFYYADNDSMQAQRVSLSAEEYWPLPILPMVAPFAGVAGGWGWMDPVAPGKEVNSFYVGIEGGVNVHLCNWAGISGSAEYLWSDQDLFLRDDFTRDDGDWNFKLGIRFYY